MTSLLLCVLGLLCGDSSFAAEQNEEIRTRERIPKAGQPEPFTFAIGSEVKARTEITPRTLRFGESAVYAVTLQPIVNPHEVERPNPRTLAEFADTFQIDDLPDDPADIGPDFRRFRWRLRPRTASAREVPELELRYFDPRIVAPPNKPAVAFPFTYADGAMLTILPAVEQAATTDASPPLVLPGHIGDWVANENDDPYLLPRWVWPFLWFGPPGIVAIWVGVWMLRHPEAARAARRRRSRAVRLAFLALDRHEQQPGADPAGSLREILAAYLEARFGLPERVRTPNDLERFLQETDAEPAFVVEVARLFAACDALRFGPTPGDCRHLRQALRAFLNIAEQPRPRLPILVLLILLPCVSAATPAESFRLGLDTRANAATARTHFRAAGAGYAAQWDTGDRRPGIAANAALAFLAADDLPQALGWYQRGLKEWPADRRLQRGLLQARALVVYPVSGEWNFARPQTPGRLQSIVSGEIVHLFCAFLLGLGWYRSAVGRLLSERRAAFEGAALLVVAGGLLAWHAWETRQARLAPALVIAAGDETLFLRRGNGSDFETRIAQPLPRGLEATLLRRRGGWVQVELPGEVRGWLPEEQVLVVE